MISRCLDACIEQKSAGGGRIVFYDIIITGNECILWNNYGDIEIKWCYSTNSSIFIPDVN